MGRFKLTLPWRGTTVIGQALATLWEAGVAEALVVTGHRAEEVMAVARPADEGRIRFVHNPEYAAGGMLGSIQAGLASLGDDVAAALLCLGDQPQLEAGTVQAVLAAGAASAWERVVIPSYQMAAGHPILLPRAVWPAVLAARDSLRAVLREHAATVDYVIVDSPSILADLDTPEDYQAGAKDL
jgi:molybdenum cofactor cytidylyltransferase